MSTSYTPLLVAQLLACLYGSQEYRGNPHHPDTAAAASALGVSRRTVQRWLSLTGGAPARIPDARLVELRAAAAVPESMRNTENSWSTQVNQAQQMANTPGLRSAYRKMYAKRGWLDPHQVIVTADRTLPLMRVSVARVGTPTQEKITDGQDLVIWDGEVVRTAARPRKVSGGRLVLDDDPPRDGQPTAIRGAAAIATESWPEQVTAPDKFAAEQIRLNLLRTVDPWRVHTPAIAALPHNATVWLAAAPRARLGA